ncbi:MAG: hypothetical protein Q4D13_07850 [Erysipelotrichaceae bacterium]|nr:hypothetical protein [Erysipelotrichaceae bacterium]
MNSKIDINEIINVSDKLKELGEDDAVLVAEDGVTKYAIIPIESYELIEQLNALSKPSDNSGVFLAGDVEELTYEEYERIKEAVLETLETSLKPKAEKMN